jgi:hypothetical protein
MAAHTSQIPHRGAALLLEHCDRIARLGHPARAPIARLEALLGPDLAYVLVHGLAGRPRPRCAPG